MTLLILAAGMGSRYGGLKQLDPMTDSGNFIIDFSVFDALRAGFDKIVFLIKRENLDLFRSTIGHRIEKKVSVSYIFQELSNLPSGCEPVPGRVKPWGTGHALLCAKDEISEPFAVINADDFYGRDTFVQLARHLSSVDCKATPAHHCMIGFKLANTLTENGSVSRGECEVDANGMLLRVTERPKITKTGNGAEMQTSDGAWVPISPDTTVSMNCWGFTPAIFGDLEQGFRAFYRANAADLSKCEYYLPSAVQEQMDKGLCDVKVRSTSSVWQGVTYPEDKPHVKESLAALIRQGEYPASLWD